MVQATGRFVTAAVLAAARKRSAGASSALLGRMVKAETQYQVLRDSQLDEQPVMTAGECVELGAGRRHNLTRAAPKTEMQRRMAKIACVASSSWPQTAKNFKSRRSQERSLRCRCASRKKIAASSNFETWLSSKRVEDQKEREVREAKTAAIMEARGHSEAQKEILTPVAKVIRDMAEVRRLFLIFDEDESGFIEPSEFLGLLAKLMNRPKATMDASEVWRHWDAVDADGSGKISFDEFQNWYCSTFGVESTPDFKDFFREEGLISMEQVRMRDVARKVGMGLLEVEKIWIEFKKLDDDGSGMLEFPEFKALINQQLSGCFNKDDAKQPEDVVPVKVVEKFWIDIDSDGSGGVSFEEFASWYKKFFCSDLSPMEQYYQMLGKPGFSGILEEQ